MQTFHDVILVSRHRHTILCQYGRKTPTPCPKRHRHPIFFSAHPYSSMYLSDNLSSYHHRGASCNYRAAMRGSVTHTRCGPSTYHHRGRAFHYHVRWPHADAHIAYYGCRLFPYQYVWHTRTGDRTTHMRYRRGKRRCLHGAGVHICYSCCRWHSFIYNLNIYHFSLSSPSHLLPWSDRRPKVPL